jgi:hypothetical protein
LTISSLPVVGVVGVTVLVVAALAVLGLVHHFLLLPEPLIR